MSRTNHRTKSPGYDFWSRRSGVMSSGPVAKWISKKIERTRNKKLERDALVDPENVQGRFAGE